MAKHTINGLNVNTWGKDTDPGIIFVHAFPLSGEMWQIQAEEFEKDHYLITYDLRSFGDSSREDIINTIDSHVDDLFSVIEKLSPVKPVICGLSMGGYITLRAVERSQDTFKAAVLCDTRSEADTNASKLNRAMQIKQIKNGEIKTFFDNFLNNGLSQTTLNGNKDAVTFIRTIMNKQDENSVMGALMTMAARTDTTAFLEKIKLPVLIIVGAEDKLTPPELSKNMHEKIKGSQFVVIPGSGHFSNIENPSAFNEALLNFLTGL
jgi:3-oxoadipate enol-lactonase